MQSHVLQSHIQAVMEYETLPISWVQGGSAKVTGDLGWGANRAGTHREASLRGYQISPPDICSPFPQTSDVHAQGHQAREDISSHPKGWQT